MEREVYIDVHATAELDVVHKWLDARGVAWGFGMATVKVDCTGQRQTFRLPFLASVEDDE